jgi:cobaltochelatase CobN
MVELTRRTNEGVAGLRSGLCQAVGVAEELQTGTPLEDEVRATLESLLARCHLEDSPIGDEGAALDAVHQIARELVRIALDQGVGVALEALGPLAGPDLRASLTYISQSLAPRLERTTEEIDNVVAGLEGRFVPAGPSGAPTRGMAHVLPTGRNFYSVDPKSLPSPIAYEVGGDLARALLDRYLKDEGRYPETVGIVVWGTAAMRTHGDDIAEVLHLLGVRPVWDTENRRVTDLEVVPLSVLGRPRIDVVLRISGFFRDAFANLVHLIDKAFELVAGLDESSALGSFPRWRTERRCTASSGALRVPTGRASCRSSMRGTGGMSPTWRARTRPGVPMPTGVPPTASMPFPSFRAGSRRSPSP